MKDGEERSDARESEGKADIYAVFLSEKERSVRQSHHVHISIRQLATTTKLNRHGRSSGKSLQTWPVSSVCPSVSDFVLLIEDSESALRSFVCHQCIQCHH